MDRVPERLDITGGNLRTRDQRGSEKHSYDPFQYTTSFLVYSLHPGSSSIWHFISIHLVPVPLATAKAALNVTPHARLAFGGARRHVAAAWWHTLLRRRSPLFLLMVPQSEE